MIVLRRYLTVKLFSSKNKRSYNHALNNLANVAKKQELPMPEFKVYQTEAPTNPYTMSSSSPNGSNVIDFNQARREQRIATAKKINSPTYSSSSTSTPGGYVGGSNVTGGASYASTGTSSPLIVKDSSSIIGNNIQYAGNQTQLSSLGKSNSTVAGGSNISYTLPSEVKEKPTVYKTKVNATPQTSSSPKQDTTTSTQTSTGGTGLESKPQQPTGGEAGGHVGPTPKSNTTNTTSTTPNTTSTTPKTTNTTKPVGGTWKNIGIGAGLTAAGLLAYNHFKNKNE